MERDPRQPIRCAVFAARGYLSASTHSASIAVYLAQAKSSDGVFDGKFSVA